MSWKSQVREKMGKAIQAIRETMRRLTPLERVQILMLLLWPIFLLIVFKACA